MSKTIKKIFRFFLVFITILGISFSNGPFYAINMAIESYVSTRDIVDKAFKLSQDENVVDKFNSYRNLAEGIKIQEAHAAASYIGNSNIIYTNGGAPGIITPNASTADGDLLVFYHYSRATGGNETVNLPAGFTSVFNSVTANRGLVAVGWRIKQAGDGTFQATITNHTAGTTGETVIEFIQTYRGTDTTNPIVNYTASLSNWASSLNIGPIAAPAIANVNDGDMAIVFGGRFENVTGQTVLTGNSLTWTVRTTANTTQGSDAGAVVQTGLNSTGMIQTVTAKTITTTGTAQAGAGRMFIIKKLPNNPPTLAISQPDGVGDSVNVGDPYNITYDLSDAEDAATVNFYYDTDTNNANGYTAIATCQNQPEGLSATCSWDTTGMALGSYYIYGIASDGVNPQMTYYSPGMVTINPMPVMDATGFVNNTEATLLDGGRSGQQITISGSNLTDIPAGSRANCSGIGAGCIRFIAGGNATVSDTDITSWTNTSITFTVNASLASYGGAGSLQVVVSSVSDSTTLDFYIYPNITSAPSVGQIGENITVSGDHFGSTTGTIKINGIPITPGSWNDTSIANSKIPGQTGIINGQIEVIRNIIIDNKKDLSDLTILAPSITSSSSSPVTNGQSGVIIHFNGSGIDTDTTPTNIRPTFWLKKTGQTSIQGDNTGTNYGVTTAYSDTYATFDLASAVEGVWDLELTNMDGLVGTCGGCLTINPNGPSVTNITPGSAFDFENEDGISIQGSNFASNATVKLTMAGETDITPTAAFTSTPTLLSGISFDLTGKKTGTWTVVVTNPDSGKSGSYTGFTIDPAITNIYQFADNADIAQPPTQNISEGEGIGNQSTAYFRLDMNSNKTSGENLIPELEAQLIGTNFQCILPGCPEKTSGFFIQTSFPYSGITLKDWLNISGITGINDGDYHWRMRLTNSAGKIGSWVEFGTDPQATNIDFYLDNTSPTLVGECPAANISDTSATVDWNTNDIKSGAQTPPGSGDFATAQVEYKVGTISETWAVPGTLSPVAPNPRAGGIHSINLSSLSPGTDYVFRARSKDYFGNEGFSGNCTFTTSAAMPIKTIEIFLSQEEGFTSDTPKSYNFTIAIPENPNNPVSIKSAIIEINGISGQDPLSQDQTINVGLLRGLQASGPLGDNFTIESSSSGPTPFTILFDALNAQGNGQENMQNITTSGPAGSQQYTLFLKGTTIPTYTLGAKLILTYTYTP